MNRKLAYAIPNIFTAASLISALVALDLASKGAGFFPQAAWLIALSILLDGFDGMMARLLNATSKIGAQADSLADFVAFGVVPGFLAWRYGLNQIGFPGFMIFIVYILCGGFRLARFNAMMSNPTKKEDFMGLPIPAAAAIVSSFIIFNEQILHNYDGKFILFGLMALTSYLMVSRIPYIAVTKFKKQKKYISTLLGIATAVVVLAIHYPEWTYLIGIWVYIGYGLFNLMKRAILHHHEHRPASVKHRRRKQ